MDLIDQVIGHAKSNAEAAQGRDRDTWAAHERYCISVKAELEQARADRDEWKQAAGVEASLRREFLAETDKLRAALKPFATIGLWRDTYPDAKFDRVMTCPCMVEQIKAARAALNHEQKAPLSYRDDPRPSEVVAKDGWPDERL